MAFWNIGKKNKFIKVSNLNALFGDSVNDMNRGLGLPEVKFRTNPDRNRVFVLDFNGDPKASQADALAQEITAILFSATKDDEVLVRINTGGGAAHAYGYAASQLSRIKNAGIPLTVSVDKIAASGGYMMACVADKIISAPWAIVGSVGVVSEMPNFFEFLKKHGIDYKQYTAGEFKRTISVMGEITEEGENKFKEDLAGVHSLFRDHVVANRPSLAANINSIATGEHWQGVEALERGLVDEIQTSEEYIVSKIRDHNVVKINYIGDKKSFLDTLGANVAHSFAYGLFTAFFSYFAKTSRDARYNR